MRCIAVVALVVPALAAAQPAQPAPSPPALDELVPLAGPVAGLPGYKLTVAPSKRHCSGQRITVTRPKQRATADPQLAAVFDLAFPTGLDFDPAPTHKARRERSMTLFNAFVEQLTRTGGAVDAFYGPQVKADDEASFAAAARLVQAKVHAGRLLASAEIPVDVRRGEVAAEKIHVFCEKMAEITKPIFDSARAPYDKCRAGAARFPDAWWAAVCRTP